MSEICSVQNKVYYETILQYGNHSDSNHPNPFTSSFHRTQFLLLTRIYDNLVFVKIIEFSQDLIIFLGS